MKKLQTIITAMLSVAVIGGCSGDNESSASPNKAATEATPKASTKPLEPVTLKMLASTAYISDEDLKILINDPLKKKYPHITVERVTGSVAAQLTAGTVFDFYVTHSGDLATNIEAGFYKDIAPLAKQHNIDLSRFDQKAMEVINQYSDKKETYALPYAENILPFYYNKDIFDRFGVTYPKDGLTWDEAITLARSVSRLDGGTKYYGLQSSALSLLAQAGINYVDYKTNTSNVAANSEKFRIGFDTGKQLFSIPNNEYVGNLTQVYDKFMKEKTVAMLNTQGNIFQSVAQVADLNWDVAQKPSYTGSPNQSSMYNLHIFIPTNLSKHQDDQMRVMEVLFSEEVQLIMVRQTARKSALTGAKFIDQFGADMPALKGKRLASVFKSISINAPTFSRHIGQAYNLMDVEFKQVVNSQIDSNTATRNLHEKLTQYIASQK